MSDNFKFCQAQSFSLSGAGAVIGDVSVTLKTFAGIDGTALTMTDFGNIGFGTLEPGNGALEEQICFTGVTQNANGTATLTGVSNVLFIAPYTKTSGLLKTHAGSTTFVISNTSGFYDNLAGKTDDETVTGIWTFTSPNYPRIDNATTGPIADEEFVPKKYADGLAISGAPKATEAVFGITYLSTAAVAPTIPIAVGNNDTRVPTQGENDALVGTSGTPSTTNKYVTNDDTSTTATADSVARRIAAGQLTVQATPLAATDAASKGYVDAKITSKNGTTTHDTTGTTTTTIAHGLGYTPRVVRMVGTFQFSRAGGAYYTITTIGTYNGSTTATAYSLAGSGYAAGAATTWILYAANVIDATSTTGAITVNGTNITITWTGTVTNNLASTNISIMWEAE